MSPDEIQALLGENAVQQDKTAPPPFVKPNRPQPTEPQGPRKKRAAAHNTFRKRWQPARIERHVLEQCPDCGYRLRGESIARHLNPLTECLHARTYLNSFTLTLNGYALIRC